jgi:hypothetical protein
MCRGQDDGSAFVVIHHPADRDMTLPSQVPCGSFSARNMRDDRARGVDIGVQYLSYHCGVVFLSHIPIPGACMAITP